jgi:chorismate dehydratase
MWHDWTGLPFVFARWMIRKTIEPRMIEYLADMLKRSLEANLARIDAIAKQRADLGMTEAEVREYIDGLSFTLGEGEFRSLDLFRLLLKEVGELPAIAKDARDAR